MTKEQINIAIAESLEWKFVPSHDVRGKAVPNCWMHEEFPAVWADYPRDYVNDLNAMHEAWCQLTRNQHFLFRSYLQTIVLNVQESGVLPIGPAHSVCNATALQRAEAYLRTIGKWDEK